jgi:hypothetical protein
VLSNEDEYTGIESQLGGQQIWMGADDIASEGHFVNVTGGPFTSTHFLPGEPNNMGPGGAPEDCILLVVDFVDPTGSPNTGLNDGLCTQAHAYLCEFDGANPQ